VVRVVAAMIEVGEKADAHRKRGAGGHRHESESRKSARSAGSAPPAALLRTTDARVSFRVPFWRPRA
jgi:hypothetical protein